MPRKRRITYLEATRLKVRREWVRKVLVMALRERWEWRSNLVTHIAAFYRLNLAAPLIAVAATHLSWLARGSGARRYSARIGRRTLNLLIEKGVLKRVRRLYQDGPTLYEPIDPDTLKPLDHVQLPE